MSHRCPRSYCGGSIFQGVCLSCSRPLVPEVEEPLPYVTGNRSERVPDGSPRSSNALTTPAERDEIAGLYLNGTDSRTLAESYGVSVRTVRAYVAAYRQQVLG